MLSKAVRLPVKSRNIFRCMMMGLLFGMLFLGKQVYWEVLLLAFIVLLLKLIEAPKDEKKRLLTNHGVIVGFFCLMIVIRYGFFSFISLALSLGVRLKLFAADLSSSITIFM